MQENSHTSSKPSSSVWQNIRSFYRSIIKHDGQGILVPLFGIILIGFFNGYSATVIFTSAHGKNETLL